MGVLVFIGLVILGIIFAIRPKSPPEVYTPPPKPTPVREKTMWEKKRDYGGTHYWICNNMIDPDYINGLPDDSDGAMIDEKEIKPY